MNWFTTLLSFYIRTKVFRKPTPLLSSFKLTFQCNLKCRMCPFHQRALQSGSHLSWDQAVDILQKLKHDGCLFVVFEGGEPFLWKDGEHDLRELVLYAKKHFLRVAVTTNGTFPLDVPADVIWVSLDGLKETHDELRSNSFDRVWSNLQNASHQNIMIHFTMHKKNWFEIDQVLDELLQVPSFRGLTVQLFYPYGQGEEPLALSPSERKSAIDKVLGLKSAGYPILNSKNTLKAMINNTWVCHDDILINVDPDGEITTGCYAKSRGKVRCNECGFTPVAEASGALDLSPGSMLAGWRIFIKTR